MSKLRLSDWVQFLTGIALVIGLGLVIWELRQTREITRAQQAENGLTQYENSLFALMGEEPSDALAKACEDPDSLTAGDMLVLNAFYANVLSRMRRGLIISQESEIVGNDWRRWTGNFGIVFATEFGRWWWNNAAWEPEIMEAGNQYLATLSERPSCTEWFNKYRNRKRATEVEQSE